MPSSPAADSDVNHSRRFDFHAAPRHQAGGRESLSGDISRFSLSLSRDLFSNQGRRDCCTTWCPARVSRKTGPSDAFCLLIIVAVKNTDETDLFMVRDLPLLVLYRPFQV